MATVVPRDPPDEETKSDRTKRGSKDQLDAEVEEEAEAEKVSPIVLMMRRRRSAGYKQLEIIMTQSDTVQFIMMGLLLVTLFLPDIWVLIDLPNSADGVLNVVLLISFVAFLLEMSVLFLIKPEYRRSFFFAMDLLGTASILLDVTMVARITFEFGQATNTDGSVLRAARLAKIGAKSGRLAKLVRMFRFLFSKDVGDEESDLKGAESVSAQLSKLLAQRVAALVMFLLVVVPFLMVSVQDVAPMAFVEMFNYIAQNPRWVIDGSGDRLAALNYKFFKSHSKYAKFSYIQPIEFRIDHQGEHVLYDWSDDFDNVRNFNQLVLRATGIASPVLVRAKYDIGMQNREESMFNICIVVMVMVMLVGFSASFNNAVELLIVNPLKRIITSLRDSAAVVLEKINATAIIEEAEAKMEGADNEELEATLETDLLEVMVKKLAVLVTHAVPGNNRKYVDAMNVDQETADWLAKEYLTDQDTMGDEISTKRFAPTKMRVKDSRTSVLQTKSKNKAHINDWNLDPTSLEPEDMITFVAFMFDEFRLFEEFNISEDLFGKFLKTISAKYVTGPTYHNWIHGFDVTHTMYRFITLSRCHEIFSSVEILSSLVATVAHDVGHPGVNNNFLISTKHSLAIVHNDRSPLENMHCATLYDVLKSENVNVFKNLTDGQWRDARKYIIGMILNTDMLHHFENVSKLQVFLEVDGAPIAQYWGSIQAREPVHHQLPPALSQTENRMMLLEVMLHAADISNPIKPFHIYEKWADRVMEEFFSQGDKERDAGIEVQPMYDRSKADKPNAQIGFIEFIVVPLYIELLALCPGVDSVIGNLLTNHETYCRRAIEKLETAEERDEAAIEKLQNKPVALREKFEAKLGHDRVFKSSESTPPVGGRRMSTTIAYGGAAAAARRSSTASGGGRRKSTTQNMRQQSSTNISARRASVQLTQNAGSIRSPPSG